MMPGSPQPYTGMPTVTYLATTWTSARAVKDVLPFGAGDRAHYMIVWPSGASFDVDSPYLWWANDFHEESFGLWVMAGDCIAYPGDGGDGAHIGVLTGAGGGGGAGLVAGSGGTGPGTAPEGADGDAWTDTDGGAGGAFGGVQTFVASNSATDGEAGSDVMRINHPITLVLSGAMASGGGGGGGGSISNAGGDGGDTGQVGQDGAGGSPGDGGAAGKAARLSGSGSVELILHGSGQIVGSYT